MKFILLGVLFAASLFGQVVTQPSRAINSGASDPATCNPSQAIPFFRNTTSGITKWCSATNTWSAFSSGGGSVGFNSITSGTNTTAAMLIGTGASLAPTGTGSILATDNTNFKVVRTSASVLTVLYGQIERYQSNGAPSTNGTGPATVTITGGTDTGTYYIYYDVVDQRLEFVYDSGINIGNYSLSGITAVPGGLNIPAAAYLLTQGNVASGAWAAVTDYRGVIGALPNSSDPTVLSALANLPSITGPTVLGRTSGSGAPQELTALTLPGPITVGTSGTGVLDLRVGTTPTNPASNLKGLFFDSGNSNHLSSIDSSGSVVDLQAAASGMAIGGAIASGTSTSVLFVDASAQLAQDSTRFKFDATNFNLLVGASGAAIRIGNIGGDTMYPGIWFGSGAGTPSFTNYAFLHDPDAGTIFNTTSSKQILFRVNNSALASIDSLGVPGGVSPRFTLGGTKIVMSADASDGYIWMNQVTPSTTNYNAYMSTATALLNASTTTGLYTSNSARFTCTSSLCTAVPALKGTGGFQSSDGTAGATGTCAGFPVVVKNGLVVSCTGI